MIHTFLTVGLGAIICLILFLGGIFLGFFGAFGFWIDSFRGNRERLLFHKFMVKNYLEEYEKYRSEYYPWRNKKIKKMFYRFFTSDAYYLRMTRKNKND